MEGLFPDKMPLIIRHTIHFISAIFPAALIGSFVASSSQFQCPVTGVSGESAFPLLTHYLAVLAWDQVRLSQLPTYSSGRVFSLLIVRSPCLK
jgi:hypothetical protein